MTDTPMVVTRDELADAALKHYDELVIAAWPDGSFLSTIPQAIEAWRNQPALEQQVERLEKSKRVAIKIIALARSLANQPTWIDRLEEALASQEEEA